MWCINRFEITGKPEQLNAFRKAAKSLRTELSFANLYPIPANIYKRIRNKDLAAENWCMAHWGVWNAPDDVKIIRDEDNYLAYFFSTYVEPPILWS